MKVFISWSGEKSRALAEILRTWIPAVLQAVRPYYSPDDIAKGTRWSTEIAKELEMSKLGLICLTADNLAAPWIMFEAGALSKNLDRSRVVPLLFGMEPSDIEGPLVQFQASRFEREEVSRVVRMMNNELGDQALAPDVLESVFTMWWPQLEQRVQAEMAKPAAPKKAVRSERELIEEVLTLTRSLARSPREALSPTALADLSQTYRVLAEAAGADGTDPTLRDAIRAMGMPIRYILRKAHFSESELDRAASSDWRRLLRDAGAADIGQLELVEAKERGT